MKNRYIILIFLLLLAVSVGCSKRDRAKEYKESEDQKEAIFIEAEDETGTKKAEIKLSDNNSSEVAPIVAIQYYNGTAGTQAIMAKTMWYGEKFDSKPIENYVIADERATIRLVKDTNMELAFRGDGNIPQSVKIEDLLVIGTTSGEIEGMSMYREAKQLKDGTIRFKIGHHPGLEFLSSKGSITPGTEHRVIKINAKWKDGSEVGYGIGIRTDPIGWETLFKDDYQKIENQISKVREKVKGGEYSGFLNNLDYTLVDLDGVHPGKTEKDEFMQQLKEKGKREGINSIGTWAVWTKEGDPIFISIMIKDENLYAIYDDSDDKHGTFMGLQREYDEDFESLCKKFSLKVLE